jgi:hypothetical protein
MQLMEGHTAAFLAFDQKFTTTLLIGYNDAQWMYLNSQGMRHMRIMPVWIR